jgi:uncharacterized protein YjbI with pentapeptide repeats
MLFLLLSLFVGWSFAVPRDRSEPTIQTVEEAATLEDPRRLAEAAALWRDKGELDKAREMFKRALEREEWVSEGYIDIKGPLREALILESMGQNDEARDRYRAAFALDIQTAMLVLRIRSHHAERDALFAEAVAEVKSRVERAKAGEQVVTYVTAKGENRYLEVLSAKQVLDQLQEGEGKFDYCYIEDLVLTKDVLPVMPERLFLNRCIIGRLRIVDHDIQSFDLKSIVLDEVSLGKTWKDDKVNTLAYGPSRMVNGKVIQSVILGRANFQEVPITGRNALFVMTVFEGAADFRDTRFQGTADFRYSVFGGDANYKRMTLTNAAFFGNTRYTGPVTFREMRSEEDLYFNSATFEGPAGFDLCEWTHGATFEDSTFLGPVSFAKTHMGGRLNMSRTVLREKLSMREMELSGMDFIGANLEGDAEFIDVHFKGKVRFSLDDVTRAQFLDDPTPLQALYRDYQGDKDREDPLTTQSSYGVTHVDDLIARVGGNLSFNNSVFGGFCIFERVAFGSPGKPTVAQFYNTQFLGETHFERTEWFSRADLTTIFANELALNEATFHDTLILDDANVAGRATLTDATFAEGATFSFYGAEIANFQIDRDQVDEGDDRHRLFYEQCALGQVDPQTDVRILRALRGDRYEIDAVRNLCYDRLADEFVGLKESFGDRAMTDDEDWAYWWTRHHQIEEGRHFEGLLGVLKYWTFRWPIGEVAFGWGVRLWPNLAGTFLFFCAFFAVIYRVFCPDTVIHYNGDDVAIKDIPWHGVLYVSMQSMGAFNTGWDFEGDQGQVGRFKYINTLQTFMGLVVLTFFVGAYTRMILA